MATSSSIPQMLTQSRHVLTSPSVATFELYETKGSLRDALIYMGVAAAIGGLLGLAQGPLVFLSNIIGTLLGFLVFTYLVHWLGTQRGGSGTLNEVAYSFALFWAPLSVAFSVAALLLVITVVGIFLLPLLGIAALVLNVYFAYLATQSSLNLEPGGKTWSVLLLAALGSFLVSFLVAAILG